MIYLSFFKRPLAYLIIGINQYTLVSDSLGCKTYASFAELEKAFSNYCQRHLICIILENQSVECVSEPLPLLGFIDRKLLLRKRFRSYKSQVLAAQSIFSGPKKNIFMGISETPELKKVMALVNTKSCAVQEVRALAFEWVNALKEPLHGVSFWR